MTELSKLKVNNTLRCSLERVIRQWCVTRVVETLINEEKTIFLLEILINDKAFPKQCIMEIQMNDNKIKWGLIWIQNSKRENLKLLKIPDGIEIFKKLFE